MTAPAAGPVHDPWRVPALPVRPGAYRWLYVDAQAGPYAVVCVFMLGALFSPRYRPGARPLDHCAVNCAVHRDGRRIAWAFSEWPGARVDDGGRTLRIGRSRFTYAADGTVRVDVDERTAPWRRPLRLGVILHPSSPPGRTLTLDADGQHRWEARVPRAGARVVLGEGASIDGVGYHDSNDGDVPLIGSLPGWRWSRVHGDASSVIRYAVDGAPAALVVRARPGRVSVASSPAATAAMRRTRWGVAVPWTADGDDGAVALRHLLESSPFYARLAGADARRTAVAEVARFDRFRGPWIRWMARTRMRVERR